VNTIEEGIDSYWLMSKDLEARIDGLFHKIGLIVKILNQNTTQLEFFTRIVDEQQTVIEEIKGRFKNISAACMDTQE
jgi:hypothetical protein